MRFISLLDFIFLSVFNRIVSLGSLFFNDEDVDKLEFSFIFAILSSIIFKFFPVSLMKKSFSSKSHESPLLFFKNDFLSKSSSK